MKEVEKVTIGEVFTILWKNKLAILLIALLVAAAGAFYSYFFFADQSRIEIRFEPVEEYSYNLHRGNYISDFFRSLYQLDTSLTSLTDEKAINEIISNVDLSDNVKLTRSGQSLRLAIHTRELDTHTRLLRTGLNQLIDVTNRYREEKAKEVIANILESINYQREYRLAEIMYLEKYQNEFSPDYLDQVFNEELAKLHLQLAQLDHAAYAILDVKETLPRILQQHSLLYDYTEEIAESRSLLQFDYIIFAVAGLFAGTFIVLIVGFIRTSLKARKAQSENRP